MHLLYKYPGTWLLEDGNRYDCKPFKDKESGLADGWSLTYLEAYEKAQKKEDEKPLTRAELESLARDRGIKFDGRWSDKRLAETVWATAKDNL